MQAMQSFAEGEEELMLKTLGAVDATANHTRDLNRWWLVNRKRARALKLEFRRQKHLAHLTETKIAEAQRKTASTTRLINHGANISDHELNASLVKAARNFGDAMGRLRYVSKVTT